jgi:preprotein translocase subunit SecD
MSIYLARTLLLSLAISIFLTVCFYALRKDLKMSAVVEFDDPKTTYSSKYIIRAKDYPADAGLQQEFKNAMQVNIAATTERLDKAGYDGKVKPENDSTYAISVQNITDTNSIRDLVSINSSFSFNEVYTLNDIGTAVIGLQKEWTRFSNEKVEDTSTAFFGKIFAPANVISDESGKPYYYPYLGYVDKSNVEPVLKMLADSAVLRQFPANIQFALGDLGYNDPMASRHQLLYALKKNSDPISNSNIVKAEPGMDVADRPYIAMEFDAAGARRWQKMTERNVGKAIAISINNKVIIAPQVVQAITGGNSSISMNSEENCRVVSVLLTSSELKLPVNIIQSQVKNEGKLSPKVLTGYINYILVFILSFAISFCVIWFVFKPGKKLSRNA